MLLFCGAFVHCTLEQRQKSTDSASGRMQSDQAKQYIPPQESTHLNRRCCELPLIDNGSCSWTFSGTREDIRSHDSSTGCWFR